MSVHPGGSGTRRLFSDRFASVFIVASLAHRSGGVQTQYRMSVAQHRIADV
jgi:hypothetical protein